jgi:BirA family transcriptional regulator, biotin operon repressor / biotin---[acetyl-CoA-carboxylase] ligase
MNKKHNPSLVKLIALLADGQYHDGTTIGEALQMTRSAVWKAIKKLQQCHINIISVKSKGYLLAEPLILLDMHELREKVQRKDVDIHLFESIDSTNNYLRGLRNMEKISVCIAEQQTNGRGRFNRAWYSPFARNIYLSCLYPFKKDISELSGLSLVISLAVIRALKDFGLREKIGVKWPNDIVYDYKKISGNLIEIQAETHGLCHAIIGMGVNVNMLEADGEIMQSWTSMQRVLQEYIDRNAVCASLLNHVFDYLQRFEAQGLKSFVSEWSEVDSLKNKMIALNHAQGVIEGSVQGINEQGHLLLAMQDGKVRAFSSGDTSVVK